MTQTIATEYEVPAPGLPPPDPPAGNAIAGRLARSVANLVGGFGAMTLISLVSTVAVTRLLGATGYGTYGAAVAVSTVLGAFSDFGFSFMLTRDMAGESSKHRPMLHAAYAVAIPWSLLLGLVMVGMALTAPISSDRGMALLVLAPAMALNGLNPALAFFLVTYRTGRLVRIQIAVGVLQMGAMVAVAAAGLGPIAVAAVVSVAGIVSNLVIAAVAERMLDPGDGRFGRVALIRRAAPLGLLSVMTRVYLTIDLVLLGWYISGPRLGDYAAGSKLLTVVSGVSGAVMNGALPALSDQRQTRSERAETIGRVWGWLVLLSVPMFISLALFAPLIVDVAVGHGFHGAIVLIRILSIAGVVTVMSNLVGNILVALRRMRPLFIQNALAITVNIAGNVILIPRYGVYAAAWMTVATEILVCGGSMIALRRDVDFGRLARDSARPLAAMGVAALVALPLLHHQPVAVAASAVTLVTALTVLRAWPEQVRRRLPAALWRRRNAPLDRSTWVAPPRSGTATQPTATAPPSAAEPPSTAPPAARLPRPRGRTSPFAADGEIAALLDSISASAADARDHLGEAAVDAAEPIQPPTLPVTDLPPRPAGERDPRALTYEEESARLIAAAAAPWPEEPQAPSALESLLAASPRRPVFDRVIASAGPPTLVLAEGTTRFADALARFDVPFLARQIDDTGHEPGGPITNVRRNAARRALAARSEDPSEVLLGIDRRIMLGTHSFAAPPADAATARAMLMALSGQVHHVVTAVALVWQGRVRTAEAVTAVTVRQLSAELIDGYLAQGRWVGRLGAYDVTGGSVLIQRVEGDYQNLTGIPPAALLDVYPALLESRRAPNLRYSWPSVA